MNAFTLKRYNHDGVLLNVTGTRDEDECVIDTITAADSAIDLIELFPVATLCLMAARIDAKLSDEYRVERAEARAELHQWHREFAIA